MSSFCLEGLCTSLRAHLVAPAIDIASDRVDFEFKEMCLHWGTRARKVQVGALAVVTDTLDLPWSESYGLVSCRNFLRLICRLCSSFAPTTVRLVFVSSAWCSLCLDVLRHHLNRNENVWTRPISESWGDLTESVKLDSCRDYDLGFLAGIGTSGCTRYLGEFTFGTRTHSPRDVPRPATYHKYASVMAVCIRTSWQVMEHFQRHKHSSQTFCLVQSFCSWNV